MAHEVYGLHMLVFWICVVIGVVVFGFMFWSVVKHRRSVHPSRRISRVDHGRDRLDHRAVPDPDRHGRSGRRHADPHGGFAPLDLTIKVTGYQWKWHYDYMDHTSTTSRRSHPNPTRAPARLGHRSNGVANYLVDVDNPLVVPTDRKIRFILTSNDVIHAGGCRSWR